MKARLIRDARIKHHAGEIVEVSPAEFNFLVSIGSAEPAPAAPERKTQEAAKEKPKRTRKKV